MRLGIVGGSILFIWVPLAQATFTSPTSLAVSNGSDWFGTGSGWQESTFLTANVYGSFSFDYIHRDSFSPPPPAWVTYSTPAKPPAEDWGYVCCSVSDSLTTNFAYGGTATSDWEAEAHDSATSRWLRFRTRSNADAGMYGQGSGNYIVTARTRIRDPWTGDRIADDTQWTLAGYLTFYGLLSSMSPDDWLLSEYTIAFDDQDPVPLFSIMVGETTEISRMAGLVIYDLGGNLLTDADLIAWIDSYRSGSSWTLDPGFPGDEFNPYDASQADKVIALRLFLFLDDSIDSLTVFSTHASSAFASVPEPGFAIPVGAALVVFVVYRRWASGPLPWSRLDDRRGFGARVRRS